MWSKRYRHLGAFGPCITIVICALLTTADAGKKQKGKDNCSSTGPNCVKSCRGLPDGDFQSCKGCNVYVTCSSEHITDRRPCPQGHLRWNDETKQCETASPTCTPCHKNYHCNIREEVSVGGDLHGSMPTNLGLRFSLVDTEVYLNLTYNENANMMAPVMLGKDGSVKPWQSTAEHDFAAYYDLDNKATVLVERKVTADGKTKNQYMGNFRLGNEQFTISKASSRTKRDLSGMLGNADDSDYTVSSIDTSTPSFEDEQQRNDSMKQFDEWFSLAADAADDALVQKQTHIVETLVVIDYAIYKKWLDYSSGRVSDAIEYIRYYYTHIMNGVHIRYLSIKEPDYAIKVHLSGLYIATTRRDSPWTEKYGIRDYDSTTGLVYSHAYRALDELIAWLQKQTNNMPFYDQVTLFTGNILFGNYLRDGSRRAIAGLADIKGVCTKYRASVNRESGQYASTQTAAHEMGHSLGALHDGKYNGCSSSDQYIMATSPGTLTERNNQNPYTFSRCTKREFRLHLRTLSNMKINCLLNTVASHNKSQIDRALQKQPGEIFSLDEQCRHLLGKQSYYCAGAFNDDRMCTTLECYDPLARSCNTKAERRAANGTTCGDHKWCAYGKCVYDNRAPESIDYCLHGDYKGKFTYLEDRTCPALIRIQSWRCYGEEFRNACCRSCGGLKKRIKYGSECEYGDRAEWCSRLKQDECYDDNNRRECCGTCTDFNTGGTGCEFGDRARWCTGIEKRNCYDSGEKTCCKTCKAMKTGPVGCEYGDRADWCRTISERECYRSDTLKTCCDWCERRRTGIEGCEFKDHVRGCTNNDCKRPSQLKKCCWKCRHVIGRTSTRRTTQPTTTTTTTTMATTTTTQRRTTTSTPPTTTTATPTIKTTTLRDLAEWCRTIPRSYCYTVKNTCIKTCASFYRSEPGCEYGDHYTWCADIKLSLCGSAGYTKCCDRCRFVSRNSPSSTTTSTRRPSTTTRRTTTTTMTTTTTTTTRPVQGGLQCDGADRASWCKTMPKRDCYVSTSTCCETCKRHWRPSDNCPFGDKNGWCRSVTARKCTFRSYQIACCESCSLMEAGDIFNTKSTTTIASTGCPIDLATWCSEKMPADCKIDSRVKTCCAVKCNVVDSDLPSLCLSGDQADWCSAIPSYNCYKDADVCCKTCQTKLTGIGGCQYGDRVSWCESYLSPRNYADCDNKGSKILRDCCRTCSTAGRGLTENPEQSPEGVLLGLKNTTLNEMQGNQVSLFKSISKLVNSHCRQNVQDCCSSAGLQSNSSNLLDLTQWNALKIADGYPKKDDGKQIWTKILVQLDPARAKEFCNVESEQSSRRRRAADTKPIFLNKTLLHQVIEENKYRIQQETGMKIVMVRIASDDKLLSEAVTQSRLAMSIGIGVAAVAGIAIFVIVVVVVIIWRRTQSLQKHRKRMERHVPSIDRSLASAVTPVGGGIIDNVYDASAKVYNSRTAAPPVTQ